MNGLLAGKAIIVTGAGSGIGRAAANLFAKEGAQVAVSDIDANAASSCAEAINVAGGAAIAIKCDVADEAQVEALVNKTVQKWGRLDGAFNNAGIGAVEASLTDDTAREWQRILNVDLYGVLYCMKHQIPAMRKSGGGAIVNNASNAGKGGVPGLASYAAAKAGVINLSLTAAVEFAAQGIRVNAVCPGVIMTETMKKLFDAGGVEAERGPRIPAQRPGEPIEVAELAAWLLSSRASYVTGQAISVDGGMNATV